jgi:hypothetical protein
MKTTILLLAVALLAGAAALAPIATAGPPDPGSGCRPTCTLDVYPGGILDLLGPPDPGNPCRPQC